MKLLIQTRSLVKTSLNHLLNYFSILLTVLLFSVIPLFYQNLQAQNNEVFWQVTDTKTIQYLEEIISNQLGTEYDGPTAKTKVFYTETEAINTSQEQNYSLQQRDANTSLYTYATTKAPGYVQLLDGTRLSGKISLLGTDYYHLVHVFLKSDTGEKYYFDLRSLSEFGLENVTVNDTPEAFTWETSERGQPIVIGSHLKIGTYKRVGFTSFGYVNLKNGKREEGALTLKEEDGKVEKLELKRDDKEKLKYDVEEVESYGAIQYVDPKFKGPWSWITWKQSAFRGAPLTNIKSNELPGYVITEKGERMNGTMILIKKDEFITQVQIGKSKIKQSSISEYGVDFNVRTYDQIQRSGNVPYDEIDPASKFYPGAIRLADGREKEGFIAYENPNIIMTNVYYAPDNSPDAPLELIESDDIVESFQEIPEQVLEDYKGLMYERSHIMGYKKQIPPQWIYKVLTYDNTLEYSTTEFQPGYVILTSGETKLGALSKDVNGAMIQYRLEEPGMKREKYNEKEVKEVGLIVATANTAFDQSLFTEKQEGFLVLRGSEERLDGLLTIKTETETTKTYDKSADEISYEKRTFILDVNGKNETFSEAKVELYGLLNVPVRVLNGDGVIVNDNQKQNFWPGSFENNGALKEGVIAWAPPNEAGKFDAFFFSSDMSGDANVYYLADGNSNVQQEIELDIEEYNPLNEDFLKTTTIEQSVKNNGYVITSDGEKIEGAVQLSFPPDLWYVTDVILTTADGVVTEYTNDGSLQKIFVTVDGEEKEFIQYDMQYVEVLQRIDPYVLIRSPNPVVLSTISKVFDISVNGTNLFESYAKEYTILNETSQKGLIYVPNKLSKEVEVNMEGCYTYYTLSDAEKRGLREVLNPVATMEFMNECFSQ